MNYIRKHIAVKLFLSFVAVMIIGMVILIATTRLSVPAAYNRHMLGMPGLRGELGPGQGGGMMADVYMNFRSSFYEALTYAGIAAVLSALAVSAYFSRRIVAPLNQMMAASQRISEGHYNERIKISGVDELGQLGERLNVMTSELEQTEIRRRQLIGDVSHELRTPLTAIKGSMEGLVDGVLPPTTELFIQIQKEADRLSRLVDDLQELSRVESGAIELHLIPVALSDLALTTSKRLSSELARKNIKLDIDLDQVPKVLADEDRLVQVLMNMVSNAIAYSPAGGQISISGHQNNDMVVISITDAGIGISPDHLPYVFDRFYRVDKSRSRGVGGGSGIGLTVTKSLVEAHGGRIWVESEGEGKGSTFSFALPVA